MSTSSLIGLAKFWAASLWGNSITRWPERRGQDLHYRTYVAHPAIRELIREYCPIVNIRLLDLGCGDGAFLDDPANIELLKGGDYLGVDVSAELIGKASEKHSGPGRGFTTGNLSELETFEHIRMTGGPRDCALTIFVIQEMPDLGSFLKHLGQVMKTGAFAFMVTVHPSFAEWLREAGAMPVARELEQGREGGFGRWRWAGFYPIVDEPREPFYLPYFHRSEKDYNKLFKQAGFTIREYREIPPADDLNKFRAQGISPFSAYDTNVYWPRIAERPSGVIMAAEKERVHG